MLVKTLVFTAIVAATPIAIVATQDPRPTQSSETLTLQPLQSQLAQEAEALAKARQELSAAREELQRLRAQMDRALDALGKTFEPQRERNCSPSRSRSLMTHYQWLRDEGHAERASGALAKVVEQVGEDQNQRNSVAWRLMTDKDTVGKFDDIALAIAQKMEQTGTRDHNHLDTIALAHSLAGQFDRAIELQKKAIAAGGNGDDHRRRLRTYEAAGEALAKSTKNQPMTMDGPVLVATSQDD